MGLQVSKDQLVSSMKGVSSTNNWDIVTSYSEHQLNAFLVKQYDAGKLAKQVKVSSKREDPLTGAKFTIDYTINFKTPKLSFIEGRSGYANLVMPISDKSSYTVTPEGASEPTRTSKIPNDKYSIKATVPLAAIGGDGKVTEQGKVITFSSGSAQKNHVVIHFKNEKGTLYKIEPQPDPKDKDILVTYFLPVLDQYFQTEVNEIDYALAAINNEVPTRGVTLFTPKSFAFASTGDDTFGVLSLYIQIEQSGNPQGNADPSFQPGDTAMSPVPEGFTASMIFSNRLMTNTFIKPQIEQNGFSVSFNAPEQGVKATLKKNVSVIADGEHGGFIFSNYEYDGLNVSLDKFPLNLTIQDSKASVDWRGTTTSGWSETASVGETSSCHYGKVDITIEMEKGPESLSVDNKNLTIPNFSFSKSDFTVKTSGHSCKWYEYFIGCMEYVPSYYTRDMTLKIPDINFALHGFDYFLETNLLSPGSEMININSAQGVSTPHDFLIVGDVA